MWRGGSAASAANGAPDMKKTYYQVLGVSRTDTADTIKKAYRKLAKENHPDLHPGDQAAEERFKEANEAWEILGDRQKRKAYDDELAETTKSKTNPNGSRKTASTVNMTEDDFNTIVNGFEDFFNPAKSAKGKEASSGPVNTEELFHQMFGFGQKKK